MAHLERSRLVLRYDSALLPRPSKEWAGCGGRGRERRGRGGCVYEGRRGVDVAGPGEEDVRFDVDEVGALAPHILSVINDGHHRITTWEH